MEPSLSKTDFFWKPSKYHRNMCIIVYLAIMHFPLGSTNVVSRPPFGPSNVMHASPRTPPRAPMGQTHAPKSSREGPPGPRRTSEDLRNEKDRPSKTCKICTCSVQGTWKNNILYFSVAPGTSQDALPFGRTRPRASEGPLHTCPGVSESPLGPKSIPKLRFFF